MCIHLLGRALFYRAEANNGDKVEAMQHIRHAAGRDYTQALFVLALLENLKRQLKTRTK